MVTLAVIIAVGLGVGLLSGLVGIGGGVLIVPFLYFFYDQPEIFGVAVSPESRVVVAHGTSLFVIMPTAVRGAFAYHRSNLVQWRAVWPIAAASVVAAFIGAALAAILPPEALKTGFGALLLLSGIRLVWRSTPIELSAPPAEPRLSILRTTLTGALIGIFSALLGVGGGDGRDSSADLPPEDRCEAGRSHLDRDRWTYGSGGYGRVHAQRLR